MSTPDAEYGRHAASASGGRSAVSWEASTTSDPRRQPGDQSDVVSFVGSFMNDEDSVTITLQGRCDAEVTEKVRTHLDAALARGAKYVTVEIIGSLENADAVCDLFARTQSRLSMRRGLLTIRGLRPHMLNPNPSANRGERS